MSRPLSSKANLIQVESTENINRPQKKKMIIITHERNHSAKSRRSKLTYEEGPYSIQCNMGINKGKMDKKIIDSTVKLLQETLKKKGKPTDEIIDLPNPSDRKSPSIQPSDKPALSSSSENEKESESDSISHDNKICPNVILTTNNGGENDQVTQNNATIKENEAHVKIETETNTNGNTNCNTNNNITHYNKISSQPTMIILNSSYNPSNQFVTALNEGNYNSCLICDKIYPISNLYSSKECKHLLCRKCIKNFYEEKIETGEKNFKCPVFTCPGIFDTGIIKVFVSNEHFNLVDGKVKSLFNMKIGVYEPSDTKYETIKKYTRKHVIDINSNENFYRFNKAKIQFCPQCSEQTLFGKSGTHFVKCLNCFYCLCKYCMKHYEEKHMDLTTEDHCKVYFRKNDQNSLDSNNTHFWFNYLIQLLLVICCYAFMFIAGYLYIKAFIELIFTCSLQKKKNNCFVKFCIFFFTILIFFLAIPVILVSYPFFPIFISIFD